MVLSDQGMYFAPIASHSFHSQPQAGWNAPLQFSGTKEIIDYFISSNSRRLIIKGLSGQVMHDELRHYIADCKWLCYTDMPTGEALALNPKYVILDCSVTPLLEVLAQFKGPVFYLQNQVSFQISQKVLALLKKRVVVSQSASELKGQLTDYFKKGSLSGVDLNNQSYVDTYIKKFRFEKYERFLSNAIQP